METKKKNKTKGKVEARRRRLRIAVRVMNGGVADLSHGLETPLSGVVIGCIGRPTVALA